MASNSSRIIKSIAIICFVLITLAVLVAWNSPASGYESSIYKSTPPLVWICLLISIASGISIIINQLYTKATHKNEWVIGLVLILLSNAVIISLHIIRGYAFWGLGDPGSHIGTVRDIITTGRIETSNIYPALHIGTAQISQITGVSITTLGQVMPAFYTLLGMVFIYYIAKAVMPRREQVIATALVGTIMIGGWYINFTPNHLGNMLFPLFLYIIIMVSMQKELVQWRLLFTIVIFAVVILHILVAFSIFFIISGTLLIIIAWRLTRLKNIVDRRYLLGFDLSLALLLLVWGITWLWGFKVWDIAVNSVYDSLTGSASSTIEAILARAEHAEGLGFNTRVYFFKVYTGSIIYAILALVALPFIWKRLRSSAELGRLFSLFGPLAFITILFLELSRLWLDCRRGVFQRYIVRPIWRLIAAILLILKLRAGAGSTSIER